MADLFHQDVSNEIIDGVMAVVSMAGHHDFLVLTKRPGRMRSYFDDINVTFRIQKAIDSIVVNSEYLGKEMRSLDNIWLGVTVEHSDYLWRIDELLKIPAAVRFVSVEPMLSEIDLRPYLNQLDWVVCGCETGPNRRKTDLIAIMDLQNQCVLAKVPFFLKQAEVDGKIVKMPRLYGKVWAQFPDQKKRRIK